MRMVVFRVKAKGLEKISTEELEASRHVSTCRMEFTSRNTGQQRSEPSSANMVNERERVRTASRMIWPMSTGSIGDACGSPATPSNPTNPIKKSHSWPHVNLGVCSRRLTAYAGNIEPSCVTSTSIREVLNRLPLRYKFAICSLSFVDLKLSTCKFC
jgi:hypothetical protein